jgi:hypothetical protein
MPYFYDAGPLYFLKNITPAFCPAICHTHYLGLCPALCPTLCPGLLAMVFALAFTLAFTLAIALAFALAFWPCL